MIEELVEPTTPSIKGLTSFPEWLFHLRTPEDEVSTSIEFLEQQGLGQLSIMSKQRNFLIEIIRMNVGTGALLSWFRSSEKR